MKGAVKRPGAFTAKAKAAGVSVAEYARRVLAPGSKASKLTKKQAIYAQVATRISKTNAKANAKEKKGRARKK